MATQIVNCAFILMNMKSFENQNQRSRKVRNLLGEIPPALVTWGTAIIFLIVMTLLMIICFVPYPDSDGESILLHLLMQL